MPDLTIPDAAVEAAARAAYEEGFLRHVRRTHLGFTWDDISDEARESWRQVVIAAAPHIAAQALEDLLTDAPPTGRVPHPFHSWREWIAYRALRLREPIEADHG